MGELENARKDSQTYHQEERLQTRGKMFVVGCAEVLLAEALRLEYQDGVGSEGLASSLACLLGLINLLGSD